MYTGVGFPVQTQLGVGVRSIKLVEQYLIMVMHSVVNAEHQYPSILMHQFMIAIIQKFVLVEGQCILGYLNLDYLNPCLSELTKLVNFLEISL